MANEVISTPSKREKLYNNLIGTGKVTQQEIGSKDDFINSITDNESAKYLYNNLRSKFDEEEIGDENKFVGYLAPDFSGPLPAGQGRLPLPNNPAEFKGFENPLIPKDIAPGTAPLKSTIAQTEIKPVAQQPESNTPQLGDIDSRIESFKKENGDFIQQYEQIRKKIEGDNQAVRYSGREGRLTSFSDLVSKAKVSKEERDFYNQNKSKFEELESSRKAMFIQKDLEQLASNAEKYDPNDSGIKKFVKGLFQTGTLKDFATLGITQISRNLDIEELLHKANTTPKLVTPQEKEAISVFYKLQGLQSQDKGWTYQAGEQLQQMVPFVLQMMTTGAMGASLKAGIGAALNVGAKTGAAKVGAKLAEGLIFNTPRSLATTTLGTTFAQNRLQGYDINNEGGVNISDTAKSVGGDLWRSAVQNYLEYATEQLGELVPTGMAAKLLGNGKVSALFAKTFGGLGKAAGTKGYGAIKKVTDLASVQAIPFEIMEEVVNALGSTALTGSNDIDQLSDPAFYKSIALNTILLGGTFKGAQLATGGIGKRIEKNRINKQADNSVAALEGMSLNVTDESLANQIKLLSENIKAGEFQDQQGSIENGMVSKSLEEVRKAIQVSNIENSDEVLEAATKAIIDGAVKTGAYDGFSAIAESEIGGKFAHEKDPNSVIIATNREGEQFYMLDRLDSKLGKEIHIVRPVNGGETKSVTADEFVDLQILDKKEWLDAWLRTRDALAPIQQAADNQIQSEEQQIQAQSAPITIDEALNTRTFLIGEDRVTVIDATEDGVIAVDDEGNEHVGISLEDLQRIPAEQPIKQPIMEGQPVEQIQETPEAQPIEQSVETPVAEAPAEKPIPLTKDGSPDYDAMEPEMLVEELSKVFSTDRVSGMMLGVINNLQKTREALNKKPPKGINEEVAKVKKINELDNKIMGLRTSIEKLNPKQEVAVRKPSVELPKASATIAEKYIAAPKKYGREKTIILANGEKLKGRYVISEAGEFIPSHDPFSFSKTEGFPINEEGRTVNDRDYEKDEDAQKMVLTRASKFDGRAISNPVIVTKDGIVVSGNDRTMAGIIAAKQGTDKEYLEMLSTEADMYGINPEDLKGFKNPRISIELDQDIPYTTETFAKFNKDDKKSQNKVEKAVKVAKTINEGTIRKASGIIDSFDTLGDFYANEGAIKSLISVLVSDGVIIPEQISEIMDGSSLSAIGKDQVETLLTGAVLNEDSIRLLNREGLKPYRNKIVKSVVSLIENRSLGDYAVIDRVNGGIRLLDVVHNGGFKHVREYVTQPALFGSEEIEPIEAYFAHVLMGKERDFRAAIDGYNGLARLYASGQPDMFSGKVKTKDEVLNDIENDAAGDTKQLFELVRNRNNAIEAQRGNGGNAGVLPGKNQGEPAQNVGNEGIDEGTGSGVVAQVPGSDQGGIELPKSENNNQSAPDEVSLFNEKLSKEEAKVNTEPSDKQKEAGNYKMGHVTVQGLDVTIENPKGSTRSGVDKSGKKWSITMNNTYGYILGTTGKDADHLDVFLGENPLSEKVFVIDQVNKDGSFDEHKVMIGFDDVESAKSGYLSNYEEGWQGLGNITGISIDGFREWADNKTRRIKPFAEYKQIQEHPEVIKEQPKTQEEGAIEKPDSRYGSQEDWLKWTKSVPFSEVSFPDFKRAITSEWDSKKEYITYYYDGAEIVKYHSASEQNQVPLRRWYNERVEQSKNEQPKAQEPKEPESPIQPDEDNSGETGAELSAEEQKEGAETFDKLQDFGQKIGMARKDTAESGFTRSGQKSEGPGWAKKYKVFLQEKSDTKSYSDWNTIPGKYMLVITNGNMFKPVRKNFDTEQEALDAIPLAEVSRNHRVYRSSDNKEEYSIYRKWSSGKLWEIKKGFTTEAEAMKYMATNAKDIIETKDARVERPHLDKLKRIGAEIRKGNVAPEKFMETFGFRGGEFGNWVASDERQSMLNFAYDALIDLAAILDISPKALSLGGRLAIGFGSRGSGLSAAAAHFEPVRGVINLTKINGAGSLAHEWFHAFDSYFGIKDIEKFAPDAEGVIKANISDSEFLSGDHNYNRNVRKEVKDAWTSAWDKMRYKYETTEYDMARLQSRLDGSVKTLSSTLNHARGYAARERMYGLRKKAATPEQLERWDALVEKANKFEFGKISPKKGRKKYSFEQEFELERAILDLNKEITGREGSALYNDMRNIELNNESIKKAKQDKTYQAKRPTTFYNGSKDMDASRSSAYWSTNLEMAARAFEAYVDDKIKAAGGQNDYLVHSVNNAIYEMIYQAKPYPEGQERTEINKELDNLFNIIEEKVDEETGNIILFRDTPYFYSPTEQALNSIKQEKATPQQWKAMLLKNGAKQAEMDWMDFDGHFADAKKSITRDDIQEWIDQNRIEVEEVTKEDCYKHKGELPEGFEVKKNTTEPNTFFFPNATPKIRYIIIDKKGKEWGNSFDTKEEAIDSFTQKEGNIINTKYSQYNLPGGKNYKELLLTMPSRRETKELDFHSSHFDEPNILAHIRFNERITPSGQRILFIEEIQSDWAQKGKKEGFKNSEKLSELNTQLAKAREEYDKLDFVKLKLSEVMNTSQANEVARLEREIETQRNAVPDMPFKKTDQWVNLSLRRMLTYAAENGFDAIAWTNGDMQAADRYDLSKQIDDIYVHKGSDKKSWVYKLEILPKNGAMLTEYANNENELENLVGKELAQKIVNDNIPVHQSKAYNGLDLKVGGEGMKAFYDNIIPAQANKIGKPFGAKVEPISIPDVSKEAYNENEDSVKLSSEAEEIHDKFMDSIEEGDNSYSLEDYVADMDKAGYEVIFDEEGEPVNLKKHSKGYHTVQSISITDGIREQAAIGMPLFSIIGEKGANALDIADKASARMNALSVARKMESSGKKAKEVLLATGWQRGSDKKWRYELPDILNEKLISKRTEGKYESNFSGEEVYSKELISAYPEIKDVMVKVAINPVNRNRGSYATGVDRSAEGLFNLDPEIDVRAKDIQNAKEILIHEIQHYIQDKEGFAEGGSPAAVFNSWDEGKQLEYQRLTNEYENLKDAADNYGYYTDVLMAIREVRSSLDKMNLQKQYWRLSGEVEARNASNRSKMTEAERRSSLLENTEDVSRKDQIYFQKAKAAEKLLNEATDRVRSLSIFGERGVEKLAKINNGAIMLDNLATARLMENNNKTPLEIKQTTGWERGADAKWRFEMPDFELKMPFEEVLKTTEPIAIEDMISDEALFTAYPQLKEFKISFHEGNQMLNQGGAANYQKKVIRIGTLSPLSVPSTARGGAAVFANGNASLKSVLSHEVQHIIQQLEGFERGGNKTTVRDALVKNKVIQLQKNPELAELSDREKEQIAENEVSRTYDSSYESYIRLGGEVEARNAQHRLKLSDKEKKATLLESTEDVARKYQFIIDEAVYAESDTPSAIHAEALMLAETLNTPVRVISDINEIPASQVRFRKAKGWFDPKTGDIIIVLPNNNSITDIQATILHEVVAHKGLRELLGSKFNSVMEAIFRSMPKQAKADFLAKYGDKVAAAEEYAANMSEKDITPSVWQKIKAIIRNAFRAIGVNLRMNDGDIAFMLWRSKNKLKNNPTAMETAKDIVDSGEMKERMRSMYQMTPQSAEIARLEAIKKAAISEKNRLIKSGSDRIGLFGDTKVAPNDMFGGEGFDPSVINGLIKEQEDLIKTTDAKISLLKQNEMSGLIEASGQLRFDNAVNFRDREKENFANENFNAELYQQIKGVQPKGHIYSLGRPGSILLSAGIENLPIELSAERLRSKSMESGHDFDLSEVYDLPNALNNPIAVFESTKDYDSSVILTELKHDGKNFTVVMRVRTNYEGNNTVLEVNSIKSIYPKDSSEGVLNWLNSEDGLLRWANKEKALSYISTQWPNYIAGGNKTQNFSDTKLNNLIESAIKNINNFNNPSNENIRFRDSDGDLFNLDTNTIALTKGEKFIEKWQDIMVFGTKLIEEIKKRGGKVGHFSNFVTEETRSSSRAKAEMDDFEDNYFKPLIKKVGEWSKKGIKKEETELYVMAKHAPERNRVIVSREARDKVLYNLDLELRKIENKRKTATEPMKIAGIDKASQVLRNEIDFIENEKNAALINMIVENGYDVVFNQGGRGVVPDNLTTLEYMMAVNAQKKIIGSLESISQSELGNNRSGMSDIDAAEIVNEFEKRVQPNEITEFWKSVNAATQFSLDKSRKYGLISDETYKATKGMYQHYVPLRSWAEKEKIDYQDIFGSNYLGHEILNSVNKQAEGRTSLADNPFGFIASMAESSVVSGNKNEVRRNAWRLIKNNSDMTDLFLIKNAWEINVADPEDAPMWEETFVPPTQEQLDLGIARPLPPNNTYKWHKTNGELEKHQVPVYIDGSRVVMEFKGTIGPRVAAAINGENVVRWAHTDGIAQFTRVMAALKTSKNPDFMLTNFLRDFFFGNMAYYVRGGNPTMLTANLGRSWYAIHKNFTKGKEDPYLKQMYEDFKMNGGQTGYVYMLGEEKYEKKIERMVKRANEAGRISPVIAAKRTFEVINHGLEYLAHMSEDAMRFSVYLTEVERMMKESSITTPTEAIKKQGALSAKDATTNFNRKGRYGSQTNAFYAFFNASIQGTTNYVKLAKENPARFITANLVLMGIRTAFAAWCLSLIGGDDDDEGYAALSDYIKENNFVIPAGSGKFITIPLPHGARAFTNIGPLALEVLSGRRKAGKATDDYLRSIVSEVSPLNLVGLDKNAFIIPTNFKEGILTFMPTAVRPLAEVAANIDFMGRPIEKKNFLSTDDDKVPRFQNAYASTNKILIGAAKYLNEFGGGNAERSAGMHINKSGENWTVEESLVWGAFDVSPAYTEHILESYFGGVGRFVNDLYKTAVSVTKGEVPAKQNIPVFRRLYQEPYETKAWQNFYDIRKRVLNTDGSIKAAKEVGNQSEYVGLNNAYNIELAMKFDVYNKIIRNIAKNKLALPEDSPLRKQADEAIDGLVKNLDAEIKEIDKRYNRR